MRVVIVLPSEPERQRRIYLFATGGCPTGVLLFYLCEMFQTAIALVIRIFANPVANVFQKQLTNRGNNPAAVNFATYLLLSAVCIVPALHIDWTVMPRGFWFNCVLVGSFGGVGNAFLVKALQHGELSVLGPINSYKSVIGMIVGIIVLGEIPNLFGLLGVALIIGGSYFVLSPPGEGFSWRLLKRRDIRWRLYAMVFTAVEAVFIKKVILLSSPTVSFITWCWFGAAASFAVLMLSPPPVSRLLDLGPRDILFYLCVAVCVGLMQYTTNYVFDRMEVGYALALFQLSVVVSVFLGYRVFRETGILRKLIGSAIMIAGSVVIIFLN